MHTCEKERGFGKDFKTVTMKPWVVQKCIHLCTKSLTKTQAKNL